MSLKRYGFTDNTYMDGKNYGVVVSSQDKIIEVFDGNVLKASVSLELNGNTLSLIGKNNSILSEVELPKSKVLQDVYFDSLHKEIVFVFEMEDGTIKEFCVNVSDLVTIYEGSNGIEVVGNKISVKIDENSKQYLEATENGLSFNADSLDSTYATDNELAESVKDMATMSWVLEQGYVSGEEASKFATKEELSNESNVREDADRVLHDWIEKEIEERSNADLALNKWIGKEVEERTNDVHNLTVAMNDKIGMVDISNPANPNRKAIILNNHDTILGKTTDGRTANIAMLSKWDKVDLGSSAVALNLNGREERPTYNDTKKIAFLSDIVSGSCGECAPKDHNHDDLYAPINHTHDEYALDEDLVNEISARETADEELVEEINSVKESLSNYAPIDHTHEDKVSWDNIGDDRKSITLPNNDMLLGTDTNGSTANIAMVNRWNVVDLGSSSLPINLNTPKDVRPTIQEAGQSGEEAHKMAYLSDLEAISDTLSGYSKVDHVHEEYVSINALNDEIQARVNGDLNLYDELTYVKERFNDYSLTSHTHNEYVSIDDLNKEISDRESSDSALSTSIENAKSELNQRIDEVSERIGNAVEFSDISSSSNPDRKAIVLGNNDMLLGEVKGGGNANIAMVNKWNIVDLGSSSLPINLNTPKNVRPTVQEQGQNGAEAHKLAYLSDVESVSESLDGYSKVGHTHDEYALQDALSNESENRINDVNRINDELAKKVSLIEFPSEEYPDRKAISLKNNDMLVGEMRNGAYAGIARITKWDVVDLGTPVLKVNINTPKNERPTIKEAGQSSAEANKMAYLSDVEAVNESLSGYSKVGHTHDEYLSSSNLNDEINERKEEDAKLSEKIDSVEAKFNDYSLTSHTHNEYALLSDLEEVSAKLDEKIGFTDIHSEKYPNRKAIVLKNNDMLLGESKNGTSVNLAMVNNWNVVDLGSSSLPINLNTPKGVRPTVQEQGQSGEEANKIAYESDVEAISASLSGYSTIDHNHDASYAKIEHTHNEYALKESLNVEISIRENEIKKVNDSLADKVSFTDISTEQYQDRKAISLANNDMILGTTKNGTSANIAMVNRWDVVDLGSSSLKINLNTPKDVRPTVQEAGQSGEEANQIAYLSDIDAVNESLKYFSVIGHTHDEYALKEALASESSVRETKDSELKSAIDTEISDRTLADGVLEGKLGNERIERVSSYNELNNRIVAEETNRTNADNEIKEELANKVEYSDISTSRSRNRKAIILNNHDCILGNLTTGGNVNIAMVSKWDKVDLGSGMAEMNLNGSADRPTYNDNAEIALLSDVTKVSDSLDGFAQADHKHAEIEENAANLASETTNREKADEDILKEVEKKVEWKEVPTAEFPNRKAITLNNHDVLLGRDTKGRSSKIAMISKWDVVDLGTSTLPINLNTPKDVRPTVQEAGQSGEEAYKIAYLSDLDNKVELTDISNESNPNRKAVVLNNHDCILGKATNIGNVNIAMVSKWNKVDLGSSSVEINLNGSASRPTYNDSKEIALFEDLNSKVEWNELSDGRKTITMKNGDMLLGTNVNGSTANIAMINKWNIVDFGTPSLPINLNTPKGVRPTVQEQGQSGEEANKIAYLSDILKLTTDLNIALGKIKTLEDKVESLSKTNVESVVISDETPALNDSNVDYIIQGETVSNLDVVGKSVKFDGVTLKSENRATIKSSDVTLNNVTVNGDFVKANGNKVISVNNAEHIVVNGLENNSTGSYNLVEIGLNKDTALPKSVLIENCNFGNSSNNSILIFGQEDGAVININNCTFGNVSNAIRLSNRTNTRCTVNITNCTFEKFDDDLKYNGMAMMQDYTSKTSEEAQANNLFGNGKITINIINCVGPNGKITMPNDISEICGSKDEKQLVYVYYSKGGLIDYDSSKYPIVNII